MSQHNPDVLPQIMVLMKGHPGVGKSSIAISMAQLLRIPLIDKDDARDSFSCLPQDGKVDLNTLAYNVMWRFAEKQLLCGLSVIVDCPLAREELFLRGTAIAPAGTKVFVVECIALDERIWQSRLEARGAQEGQSCSRHKPQTWDDLQALLTRYAGCDRWSERMDRWQRIVIHTTDGKTPMQQTHAVIQALRELLELM